MLKKKKFLEKNLINSEHQLDNIDELINNIEFSQVQQKVFESMKAGTQSLNKLNEMMKLDDVEQLMDDTKDAIEYQEVCE